MSSTITVNSLARKVLGPEVSQSFDDIHLEIASGNSSPHLTVDELAQKHLPGEVNNSLAKSTSSLEIGIEINGLRVYAQGKGLSLLIIVLTIASLLVGANEVLALVQSLANF